MDKLTETPITTAARRIARVINGTSSALNISFDAEGIVVDMTEVGLSYLNPSDQPPYAVKLQGCKDGRYRLTERWAQIHLDASANARTRYPEYPAATAYNTYLHEAEGELATAE